MARRTAPRGAGAWRVSAPGAIFPHRPFRSNLFQAVFRPNAEQVPVFGEWPHWGGHDNQLLRFTGPIGTDPECLLQTPFRAPADGFQQFSARNRSIGKVMKRSALAFSVLVVFLGGVLVATPVFGQDMSFKIGLNRASTSGMEYTHDDGTTPVT
ncbi:MAG: hypothetical protein V3S64_17745, partial [bacterium]